MLENVEKSEQNFYNNSSGFNIDGQGVTVDKNSLDDLRAVNEKLEKIIPEKISDFKTSKDFKESEVEKRKQVENSLIKSEHKFSTAFKLNPSIMVIYSLEEMVILDVNESFTKVIGYSREEAIKRKLSDLGILINSKDEQKIKNIIQEYGEIKDLEIQVKLKDSTIRTGLLSAQMIELDGRTCLLSVFNDFTEYKIIQNILNESKNKLKDLNRQLLDIIEFLPDPTFVLDNNKRVIAWNHEMEILTGVQKNDILGQGNYEYALPFYAMKRPILINIAMDTDPYIPEQYEFVKKKENIYYTEAYTPNAFNGKGAFLSASATALLDSKGKVIGAIESIKDITDRKNMELELKNSRDELEIKVKERTSELSKTLKKLKTEIEERKKIEIELQIHKTQLEKLVQERTAKLEISKQKLELEIEERKRTEEKLIKSNTILNSIEDGVFMINENGVIISFNKAIENMLGFSSAEIVHSNYQDFFNLIDLNLQLNNKIFTGRQSIDEKINIKRKNGKIIPIRIYTTIIKGDQNRNEITFTIRDLSQVEILRKEIEKNYNFNDIISKNPRMQEMFSILPDIAKSDSTVLIEGPTGTGKELFAKAIYNLSTRKNKPFVTINCGAISPYLIESELFGYIKGSFTDAKKDKIGKIITANNGTIFFDEIGELPFNLQVKLLRLLENFEVEPIGSNKPVKVNIRIIAATNRNLQIMVKNGSFREDLFYRLNTVKLYLPPLSERKEDIPYLIEHFIIKLNARLDKNIKTVDSKVLQLLYQYPFPGNVRELEKIIEYAFIICRGPILEVKHLPPDILERRKFLNQKPETNEEEKEKERIISMLQKCDWNKSLACKELKMHYTTLFRKIKKYDIHK